MQGNRLTVTRILCASGSPIRAKLVSLATLAVVIGSVFGLCPVDEPLDPDFANNNSYYVQICNLDPSNGILCPTPGTPVISSNGFHAQGARLTAFVPNQDGLDATAVWWQAAYFNDNLWWSTFEHRSTEGFPVATGTAVDYGVPGLEAGKLTRFRVAFEFGGAKTCWSDWAVANTEQPHLDAEHGADPPGDTDYRVIDEFDRPETQARCANSSTFTGDGIGPESVWVAGAPASTPCARIEVTDPPGSRSFAYFPISSQAVYVKHPGQSPDSFAEALVTVDGVSPLDPWKFNFQVQTRVSPLYA